METLMKMHLCFKHLQMLLETGAQYSKAIYTRKVPAAAYVNICFCGILWHCALNWGLFIGDIEEGAPDTKAWTKYILMM